MRVAELTALRHFQVAARPAPAAGAGEVLVRVRAVGICGSDLHNFSEGGIGDMPSAYPMVLGHEPAGEVCAVGAGVTGWAAGDRVMMEPAIYCYHCEYCLTGHHNLCTRLRFLSQPGDPGYFRELVSLPVANLLPVPPGLGLAEATLFEPLAVALHSLKFAALRPGETAAVFGAGPIGLLTIAALRLSGAGRILAVEPVKHRREMALVQGADAAIDPAAEEPGLAICAETGGRGADVTLDCAARGESLNQCLCATRPAGRVVVTGIPSEQRVPLDLHTLRRKELGLFNVRRSNHESEVAVALLRQEPSRFGAMITHRAPLDRIEKAFSTLENYEEGVGKVVIEP